MSSNLDQGSRDVHLEALPRISVVEALHDPRKSLTPILLAIPGWEEVSIPDVDISQISGAMTNVVFRASAAAATEFKSVILRLFGPGNQLFSQRAERGIFLAASDRDIGPKCLLEFPGGRVEEFLPGFPIRAPHMRTPPLPAAIAAAMARFHVEMLDSVVDDSDGLLARASPSPAPPASLQPPSDPHPLRRRRSGSSLALLGSSPVQLLGSSSFLSRLAAGHGSVAAAAEHLPPGAGGLEPAIYARIARWHATAREVCARGELKALRLDRCMRELSVLRERTASRFPLWLGFCHNDLQYGNMLLGVPGQTPVSPRSVAAGGEATSPLSTAVDEESAPALGANDRAASARSHCSHSSTAAPAYEPALLSPEALAAALTRAEGGGGGEEGMVHLIDYEYATLNDVAFDIANHFCEYAADYHSGAAHELDFACYPSPREQAAFCAAYVDAVLGLHGAAADGEDDDDGPFGQLEGVRPAPSRHGKAGGPLRAAVLAAGAGAAELLLAKVRDAVPLSHLTWGLWGLIQHRLSDVDFDYRAYAQQRIQQYHATKMQALQEVQDQEGELEDGEHSPPLLCA